jgi:hypothetical protein
MIFQIYKVYNIDQILIRPTILQSNKMTPNAMISSRKLQSPTFQSDFVSAELHYNSFLHFIDVASLMSHFSSLNLSQPMTDDWFCSTSVTIPEK